MSRIFIALTPEQRFNQQIIEFKKHQQGLQLEKSIVNWAKDNSHHLTINLIGEMEPEQIEEMFNELNDFNVIGNILNLEIIRISYFPNDNGQVLVANIELTSQLKKLFDQVEKIVAKIGVGISLKSFKPHITLARFKDKARPFKSLLQLEKPIQISFKTLDVYNSKFYLGRTRHKLIKTYDL